MKNDLFIKAILVVIAVLLLILVIQNYRMEEYLKNNAIDVDLRYIDKDNPLPVQVEPRY